MVNEEYMLRVNGLDDGFELFRTLGSEMRMQIVKLLAEGAEMSLNEIASSLGVTNGALTPHIRKLESVGIICVRSEHTKGGIKKICSLTEDQLLFDLNESEEEKNKKVYETRIRIGHYSDYSAHGPCGLANEDSMIGSEDDPRCFAYPERVEATMLYLHDGYVEYRIPDLVPDGQRIVQLTVSFEISSADQGNPGDTLSDISFYLNGEYLGGWLTIPPSDTGRGIYTPKWWRQHERQHGFLKMLVINHGGVFLDGKMIVEGVEALAGKKTDELKFRIEAHPVDGHEGGLALYGKNFGNYDQDILVRVHYMPEEVVNG
jgi:predicted transcriptional regulator